ncbi:hypothetical protein [Promineifilum sp.]|uniref:hypothetical protein n=1 Tax=Promineifilum sp. TaxID=2664178 RepID=UPI0035B02098
MSERFTPSEAQEAKEPVNKSSSLSSAEQSSIEQKMKQQPAPGSLDQKMSGEDWRGAPPDAAGVAHSPERVEHRHPRESEIEREPRTMRPAAQPPADDSATPPAAPSDSKTPRDAGAPPRELPQASQLGDVGMNSMQGKSVAQDQHASGAHAKAANMEGKQTFPPPDELPDSSRFAPLAPELKLELSNIQNMPVEQRREAMADLFKREGNTLSQNAGIARNGDGVWVKDASGFVWNIDYKE